MDDKLLAVLLGVGAGGVGYLVSTFWMRPVLRYLELKEQVLSDMIFYANVINANDLNDEMKERMWERSKSNRRHAADLTACMLKIPFWFRLWLRIRKERPEEAVRNLLGLSNTFRDLDAADRIDAIKKCLRVETEMV